MLAAVYLSLKEKPGIDEMTTYYHRTMTENAAMNAFLKSQNMCSKKAQAKLAHEAKACQTRPNPYTWTFRYEPGISINSFTTYFDTCVICCLFRKLGISEVIPAMCTYDYDMADFSGCLFTRQYTLAKGGPFCDCHYERKQGRM